MRFRKTKRERYPRKMKKETIKHISRIAFHALMGWNYDYFKWYERFKTCSYTPCTEFDAIIPESMESAKNQPKNMSKDEEIAYMIGDSDVSSSLVESVNRCVNCDAFSDCSLSAFPVDVDDKACKYYIHE